MNTGGTRCVLPLIAAVWGLLIAGWLPPTPAWAEVKVVPVVLVEGEYSDNYFRAQDNETTVYTLHVSPGVTIDAYTEESRFTLSYRLHAYWYSEWDEDIDVQEYDYVGHEAFVEAYTLVGSRVTVGVADTFFVTREAASADIYSLDVGRDLYWLNQVRPYAKYDIAEKGQIQVAYQHEMLDYIDSKRPGNQGSVEARGIVTLTYNMTDTRHLDFDAQAWRRWFEEDFSRYDSYQAMLIYRHEFNEYMRGDIGAGYHWRDWDDEALDDWDSWVGRVSFTFAGEDTLLNLELTRNINDFSQENTYYTSYRFTASAERKFYESVRARLGGYYQFSEFIDLDRDDNVWNVYGSIGYIFLGEMFEATLKYSYTERDSDVEGADYDEHQLFLSVQFTYDWEKYQ